MSTDEAVEATGASYRQLDYWVRTGLLSPATTATSGEGRGGKYSNRRWSPVDVLAAGVTADIIGLDPSRRPRELAELAVSAVYRWHGRVPWVVVALEDTVEPAVDAEAVAGIVERLTVATIIPLGDEP